MCRWINSPSLAAAAGERDRLTDIRTITVLQHPCVYRRYTLSPSHEVVLAVYYTTVDQEIFVSHMLYSFIFVPDLTDDNWMCWKGVAVLLKLPPRMQYCLLQLHHADLPISDCKVVLWTTLTSAELPSSLIIICFSDCFGTYGRRQQSFRLRRSPTGTR